jgi:hypothetical protein
VEIHLLGGNDTASVSSAAMPITIDGGAGTDTVNVVATSFGVPAVIVGSAGDDTINVNVDGLGVARATLLVSQTIGTLAVGAGGVATLEGVTGMPHEVLVVKNSLKLTGGGKLDLKNNDLALNYYTGSSAIGAAMAGDYNGVLGLVQDGRAGGSWTGGGLVTSEPLAQSSTALASLGVASAGEALGITGNSTTLFDGQIVDASTVLVRYTFAGDADLNLDINGDDFFRIDAGFASGIASWFNGDFNYSGTIDADDYFSIDSNYNDNAVVLATPVVAPILASAKPQAERKLLDELI